LTSSRLYAYTMEVSIPAVVRKPFVYKQYNVTLTLILINFFIFLITVTVRPGLAQPLAMNPLAVVHGNQWWQVFTYMFVHGNFTHVLFNMLALFFFGTQLEYRLGSSEFLLFYLLTGVLAGVFSLGLYWFSGAYMVFLVGASGAVYAVLLAFATFFPNARIFLFGILPVPAPALVVGFTFIELFSQISGGRGNVAHFTHLAGFAFAFLYLMVRFGVNPAKVFMGHR